MRLTKTTNTTTVASTKMNPAALQPAVTREANTGFDDASSFEPGESKSVKLANLPQSGPGSLSERAQGGDRYGWYQRDNGEWIRIEYKGGFKK